MDSECDMPLDTSCNNEDCSDINFSDEGWSATDASSETKPSDNGDRSQYHISIDPKQSARLEESIEKIKQESVSAVPEPPSKKKKLMKTEEQLAILAELYERGMKNVRDRELVAEAVERTGLPEVSVKEWISNKKKPNRGSLKKRAHTGNYNEYTAFISMVKTGFNGSAESLGKMAKARAMKYQELKATEEGRLVLKAILAKRKNVDPSELTGNELNIRVESIYRRIREELDKLEALGYKAVTIVAQPESDPALLGSPEAVHYFHKNMEVTEDFANTVLPEREKQDAEKDSLHEYHCCCHAIGSPRNCLSQKETKPILRQRVQALFNKLYARASGSRQPMPYASITSGHLKITLHGLPEGLSLKKPNLYQVDELKNILQSELTLEICNERGQIKSATEKPAKYSKDPVDSEENSQESNDSVIQVKEEIEDLEYEDTPKVSHHGYDPGCGHSSKGPMLTYSQEKPQIALRHRVQTLYNTLYAEATGKHQAMPYAAIAAGHLKLTMHGLPRGVSFKKPSLYTLHEMRHILHSNLRIEIHDKSIGMMVPMKEETEDQDDPLEVPQHDYNCCCTQRNKSPGHTSPQKETKSTLRQRVQILFNNLYAEARGQKQPMPYAAIAAGHIKITMHGLPEGLLFKKPSFYQVDDMKRILQSDLTVEIHDRGSKSKTSNEKSPKSSSELADSQEEFNSFESDAQMVQIKQEQEDEDETTWGWPEQKPYKYMEDAIASAQQLAKCIAEEEGSS